MFSQELGNSLSGRNGNDLIGGAGNDKLYGGTGADQLVGGQELTCHGQFPPVWIRVRPIKGRTHEEAAIYGRAD
ncbi:hypothetical protein NKY41_12580, partial [Sinorhizobium meliloti]